MAKLIWDATGERLYETGVDHGILFLTDAQGNYKSGVVWNGITGVSESPSGGESNAQYADNMKYLDLLSKEEFGATVTAYTFPDEFAECDGGAYLGHGVTLKQQTRKMFGFAYRSLVGNDVVGEDYGYKLHLIYGCKATPSERSYNTTSDSPEAIEFSWEFSTTPIPVDGYKPISVIELDSTKGTDKAVITKVEEMLIGSDDKESTLPMPSEILAMIAEADATPQG